MPKTHSHSLNDAIDNSKRPIVICCGNFNENIGGVIVLHYLVDRLRALGFEAFALPTPKKISASKNWLERKFYTLQQYLKAKNFKSHASMVVPVASKSVLEDAVIVYPETVSGNPLGASRVVRWLLNKPGFFGVDADIGTNELIFFYQEAFAEDVQNVPEGNLLQIRWLREDVYFDQGGPRKGACRMIRKGTYDKAEPDAGPADAVLLDGKSHEEIAEIFNETQYFYCHDPYTMFAYYAALCGCIPIVVPPENLTAEMWRAGFELKHGVAFGESEIEWARDTRHILLEDMQIAKRSEEENVQGFVQKIQWHFS